MICNWTLVPTHQRVTLHALPAADRTQEEEDTETRCSKLTMFCDILTYFIIECKLSKCTRFWFSFVQNGLGVSVQKAGIIARVRGWGWNSDHALSCVNKPKCVQHDGANSRNWRDEWRQLAVCLGPPRAHSNRRTFLTAQTKNSNIVLNKTGKVVALLSACHCRSLSTCLLPCHA